MDKDIIAVRKIVSNMLETPSKNGACQTSAACSELENYIESVRAEAIGWAHGYACNMLDRGEDPRTTEVPGIYSKGIAALAK